MSEGRFFLGSCSIYKVPVWCMWLSDSCQMCCVPCHCPSSHAEPVSEDVDDLLCESIDAGNVKERGQVRCGGEERGR